MLFQVSDLGYAGKKAGNLRGKTVGRSMHMVQVGLQHHRLEGFSKPGSMAPSENS